MPKFGLRCGEAASDDGNAFGGATTAVQDIFRLLHGGAWVKKEPPIGFKRGMCEKSRGGAYPLGGGWRECAPSSSKHPGFRGREAVFF